MIPAVIGIALITFTLMHITRGGPFSSERGNPAVTNALNQAYGLNDPLWPTFYGPGSELWPIILGVIAFLILGAGIFLKLRARSERNTSLALGISTDSGRSFLNSQQISSILMIVGTIAVAWLILVLTQGPPTKLGGSGFSTGQFVRFFRNFLVGDLGPSFSRPGQQVTDILASKAINSFILGFSAFMILILIAVPLGILAAVKQNTWVDYAASTFSLIGYSIPNFVVGVMFILITGVWLDIVPVAQWGEPRNLVLAALALAIRPMAVLTRLTRASMLEVLNQDYIRTAWAKGLHGRAVLLGHALRNALLPVVTVMGDQLGDLVTGSLVIERLFRVPGIGEQFVLSVEARDYGIIMGTTMFYAMLVLVINLFVDVLYGVIDPRVRLGAAARG
ncbi:MAG: ABC transporter permease [Chloroflexota bacterium]